MNYFKRSVDDAADALLYSMSPAYMYVTRDALRKHGLTQEGPKMQYQAITTRL